MGQDQNLMEDIEEAHRVAALLIPYIVDLCLERKQIPFLLAERTRTALVTSLSSGQAN